MKIAANLALPPEAVTQTFALLAKRGAGKTYCALVMAEEMLSAGHQIVVADPVGVCWGLRASADGKGPGLPITILGGDHGDLPLESTAGELVADLVVQDRASLVLDLSAFRKAEAVRFMTAFAERLYHSNRKPLHLFLDEADSFAPQRPQKGQERMLGAVEDLVRRGRARGIGITMATQRAAVLNKDVLTQIEVLIAMRMVGPQDRAAIDEWIKAHGTPEERATLMASLASLPIGTAWFWSPGWLDLFQRIEVRRRRTFDSSATPKAGAKARASSPKHLAAVDLQLLQERMRATIERAKADDPRELHKQIAALKKHLADLEKRPATKTETVTKTIEVEVVTAAQRAAIEKAADRIAGAAELVTSAVGTVAAALARISSPSPRSPAAPPAAPTRLPPRSLSTKTLHQDTGRAPRPAPRRQNSQPKVPTAGVSAPQQRILDALAWLETVRIPRAHKTQLALWSGASPTSSGYTNNLGSLRAAGLVDYPAPGQVSLTDAGRGEADMPPRPPTTEEMHARLLGRLPGPQGRILAALIEAYPEAMPKPDLAEVSGASPTSSGYTNNLGSLRSLGLIDYPSPGYAVALPVLFLD